MYNNDLVITPLGGLKQIGSNMILLEHSGSRAIIDCGILFPNDQCYGINYLIPNYTDIEQVDTLFITHGHEDHIGAIVHLLEIFPNIKIYAPPFAKLLITHKLSFSGISKDIDEYDSDSILPFSNLAIHPIRVNHSIPDTYGLLLLDKANNRSVFYASDFKIDLKTTYEPPFELEKLKKLTTNYTQRILMADSTNILNPKKSYSEADVIPALSELISNHSSRIFITLFASNIHRLQTIFNIAKKQNKFVYSYGRSISNYIQIAKENKYITPHNYIEDVEQYKGGSAIILLTGCQGEFRGALKRVATGENPYFTANPDDLFIFSSKVIPGNEKSVSHVVNLLSQSGATIVTEKDRLIHVTGHPGQEDLKILIDAYTPTDYVPIHGETYFLQKQISFIKNNYPKIEDHFLTNFDKIIIKKNNIEIEQHDENLPILIHGNHLFIEREQIAQRRKIASQGLVIVIINKKTLNFEVLYQGLPLYLSTNFGQDLDLIVKYRLNLLRSKNGNSVLEQIRIELRREIGKIINYKPIVIVKDV